MDLRNRWALASSAALAFPTLAHAHHAMGGTTPSNFFEGFVSGLAHPVIGIDHLLFVLAVGAACYAFRLGAGTVAAFLGCALAGTLAHYYRLTVPYAEAWVAASLIVAGALLLLASRRRMSAWLPAFFALAGLAHGYAYGESIVGAEATPLFAYLAGFTLVQIAIALTAYSIARALDRSRPLLANHALGGVLSLAGVVLLALSFTG
ncbi:MAG TPA: HupE/UreJ family protein [Burkholderiales bacterium]|nr:HupE/UreJ family protein [Burkholderiales bacterium]